MHAPGRTHGSERSAQVRMRDRAIRTETPRYQRAHARAPASVFGVLVRRWRRGAFARASAPARSTRHPPSCKPRRPRRAPAPWRTAPRPSPTPDPYPPRRAIATRVQADAGQAGRGCFDRASRGLASLPFPMPATASPPPVSARRALCGRPSHQPRLFADPAGARAPHSNWALNQTLTLPRMCPKSAPAPQDNA